MLSVSTDGYGCDVFYDLKTFEFLWCNDAILYGNDVIDPPMEVVLDKLREDDEPALEESYISCFHEEWMAEDEARERSSVTSLWDLDDMMVLRAQIESRAY